MKKHCYSRKLRQLKSLKKRLIQLHKEDQSLASTAAKKLIQRIRFLAKEIAKAFSPRYVKNILGAFAILLGSSFQSDAQYIFAPAQNNPFGLQPATYYNFLTAADLDGDGDYDILAGTYVEDGDDPNYGGAINYFENIGTPENPAFATPVTNPFGLQSIGYIVTPEAADLDGDGDIDILIGGYVEEGYLEGAVFFENTGDASNPQFAEPVVNPFGLEPDMGQPFVPSLVDIDDDGDLDIVAAAYAEGTYDVAAEFIENIGSATNPNFADPVDGLPGIDNPGIFYAFGDLDSDGDLDILTTNYGSTDGTLLSYYRNTGTSANAQFQNIGNIIDNQDGDLEEFAAIELVDLDNDGDLDLLLGAYSGTSKYDAAGIFVYHENNPALPVGEISSSDGITLFPNPADNEVYLSTKFSNYSVTDAQGKEISVELASERSLDTSELDSGIYYVRLQDLRGNWHSYKFIKK